MNDRRELLMFRDLALRRTCCLAAGLGLALLTVLPAAASSPADPGLGSSSSFAVLATATITNTGPSVLTGDVGLSPGTSITGFPPGVVVGGSQQVGSATAATAVSDARAGYADAVSRASTGSISADLAGQDLVAGVYDGGSLALSGQLTLDGQGNPDSTFLLRSASTLITADASSVQLVNGAQACHVFWQLGSSATIAGNSQFVGTVLANNSVTAGTGATVDGRLIALDGAVTLDSDDVSTPTCLPASPAAGGSSATATPVPSTSPSSAASTSPVTSANPSTAPNPSTSANPSTSTIPVTSVGPTAGAVPTPSTGSTGSAAPAPSTATPGTPVTPAASTTSPTPLASPIPSPQAAVSPPAGGPVVLPDGLIARTLLSAQLTPVVEAGNTTPTTSPAAQNYQRGRTGSSRSGVSRSGVSRSGVSRSGVAVSGADVAASQRVERPLTPSATHGRLAFTGADVSWLLALGSSSTALGAALLLVTWRPGQPGRRPTPSASRSRAA